MTERLSDKVKRQLGAILLIRLLNILSISRDSAVIYLNFSTLIYLRPSATYNCVCSSKREPMAICKNLLNSFFEFLPYPSAILLGIESAHLCSCTVNPYISCFGKFFVKQYIFITNLIDFLHTIKFRNVLMTNSFLIH